MDDYISFEQIPFGSDSFAENPEPRCPCILVLDTSASMAGAPIWELNQGVKTLKSELLADPLARKRVELSMVTFGPVQVASHFFTAPAFSPVDLVTTSDTPMGEAVLTAIELVAKRKAEYKAAGIAYYKPWIILITDGSPTDEIDVAAERVKEGEDARSFAFFAIGVEGASMATLAQLSVRAPLKLKGLMFREFFMWLSASMKMVSAKTPGTTINMLPPTGWTEL